MNKTVLYTYWRSSCSWRVRIALVLKGIEYESRPVNLVKDGGLQHSDEYKELNPAELVPTLFIDGHKLTESLSILEYLEETRPGVPILPKDSFKRSQVRTLALHIVANIQPVQNLKVLQYVGDDRKMSWGKHFITEGFKALELLLQPTAGKYCVGDDVTVADICLVPQVYNAGRFAVDLNAFPTIKRIHENLEVLDAFKSAHPSRQPDTPAEEKQ